MTGIRIVSGSPTAEEVAVILAALTARTEPTRRPRSTWGAPLMRTVPERRPWRSAQR